MHLSPRFAPSKFKILLLLFLTGCAATIATSDLQNQPLDQSVQVKGKVITVAPMINQSAYEVQDDRGTVWILTKKQPPKLDSEVSATGKLKFESIQVEGEEIADRYLEED
jgi:RecJ-like exonuclease